MGMNNKLFIEKLPGHGPLSFVLIHNAGGNHQFFTHQISILQKYGEVIWLDLPGHGTSNPILSYTMRELSDVIIQNCLNLGLENIWFVGLNNGANIIIENAFGLLGPLRFLGGICFRHFGSIRKERLPL